MNLWHLFDVGTQRWVCVYCTNRIFFLVVFCAFWWWFFGRQVLRQSIEDQKVSANNIFMLFCYSIKVKIVLAMWCDGRCRTHRRRPQRDTKSPAPGRFYCTWRRSVFLLLLIFNENFNVLKTHGARARESLLSVVVVFFFCRFEGAHMRSPQAAPMCQKRFGPRYFVVVSRQFFRATLAASRPVYVQRRFGSAGRCHCQRTLALLTTACFPIAAAAIEPATRSLSKNIWF